MELMIMLINKAMHNTSMQIAVIAILADMFFGLLRAIKEKEFNSSAGINGAIRKIGMLASLVFLIIVDCIVQINLLGFIPLDIRNYLNVEFFGLVETFSLLYVAYEITSVLKNMVLCGLPVKIVWLKVKEFLKKYTAELPKDKEA